MSDIPGMLPGQEVVSLRVYYDARFAEITKNYDARIIDVIARFETVLEERDRLYDTRFKASEVAVNAALAAQEKAVNAAYAAQEKAVLKAEDAQKDYNQRSNEFRGQLDDQAKLLMSRSEALGMFAALEGKLILIQKGYDDKFEAFRLSHEKIFDGFIKEIAMLRESQSAATGAAQSKDKSLQTVFAIIGAVVGLLLIGSVIVGIAYAIRS